MRSATARDLLQAARGALGLAHKSRSVLPTIIASLPPVASLGIRGASGTGVSAGAGVSAFESVLGSTLKLPLGYLGSLHGKTIAAFDSSQALGFHGGHANTVTRNSPFESAPQPPIQQSPRFPVSISDMHVPHCSPRCSSLSIPPPPPITSPSPSPSRSPFPSAPPAFTAACSPAVRLSPYSRRSPDLAPHSPPHLPPWFPPCRAATTTSAQPPRGPVHMQQQARLRVYMQSPGVIGDPYCPPPPMPFLSSWFTKAGWKRRWAKWTDMIRTGYTIAMMRRHNKGYSRKELYRELAGAYKQINRAIATDDRTALRHLVTENAFSSLKHALKHRADRGIARVEWHLVGSSDAGKGGDGSAGGSKAVVPNSNKPPLSFKTLQARLISLEKSKPENGFVQITLEIKSKQRIATYDKRGKLTGGDPNAEIDVKDIWVFERHMLHPELPWRLCGQLVAAPPGADKAGKQLPPSAAVTGR